MIVSAFVLFQSSTIAILAASPQTGTPGTVGIAGGAALVEDAEVVVAAEVEFKARPCWYAPATHAAQANGQIGRRTAAILRVVEEIRARESLPHQATNHPLLQVRAETPYYNILKFNLPPGSL